MFSEFEINDVNKHYLRFRISSGANLVTLALNSLVGTYELKIVGGFRAANWTLPATLIDHVPIWHFRIRCKPPAASSRCGLIALYLWSYLDSQHQAWHLQETALENFKSA